MKTNRKRSVLENGVRVISERLSFSKSVSIGIWINIGSRDDPLGKEGISHFLEHMLFKGTQKRSALDIAKEFDQMGGFSNAFTSKETTCLHAKVLSNHLENIIELFADLFLNSKFEKTELKKEKDVIIQEINMVEDSPDEYIHEIFPSFYWPNHGLSHSILGTKTSILSITDQDIKQFFSDSYRASRIVIAGAGDVEHEHFVELVNKFFIKIPKGHGPKRTLAPTPNLGIKTFFKKTEQAHFILSCYAPTAKSSKRFLYSIFNVILGGSMSSRIFQEIREKRGLSYSIYSFTSYYEDTGTLSIYGACAQQNLCEIIKLLVEEIEKISRNGVSFNELNAAKEYIRTGILISLENIDSRMSRLAKNEIYFHKFLTEQEVLEKIESITIDDIKTTAKEIIQKGFCLVTLGPIKEKQLVILQDIIDYSKTTWRQKQNDISIPQYQEDQSTNIKII